MVALTRKQQPIAVCSTCHIPVKTMACPICDGDGRSPIVEACESCDGDGNSNGRQCRRCGGEGKYQQMEVCVVCYGSGNVQSCPQCDSKIFDDPRKKEPQKLATSPFVRPKASEIKACEDCGGKGIVRQRNMKMRPCKTCRGTGKFEFA